MTPTPTLRDLARVLLIALTSAFAGGTATAHDFWIQPSKLRPEPALRLSIDLFVGERLAGEKVARNPEKIARFFAVGPDGKEIEIVGIDAKTPAGYLRVDDPGRVTIGYRSRPSTIELEAAKFEAYLAEEGLEPILDLRRKRAESARPGRETYSRCAKSLITVGASADRRGFDRRLGFPLELVLENDPYALAPGDELALVLDFRGAPLAGALVGCQRAGDPEHEVRLRTDAAGRVRFTLAGSGFHLVRVVHMVAAPAESGQDWESLWASQTFEIADVTVPAAK